MTDAADPHEISECDAEELAAIELSPEDQTSLAYVRLHAGFDAADLTEAGLRAAYLRKTRSEPQGD